MNLKIAPLMMRNLRKLRFQGLNARSSAWENSFKGGTVEGGPRVPKERLSLCHMNGRLEKPQHIPWIQPSLRDSKDVEFDPGSELPGYSQISLRETENAAQFVHTNARA